MTCFKYIIANACGHRGRDAFVYCNSDHDNEATSNSVCYESVRERLNRDPIKICVGSSFCSSRCEAVVLGWFCCSCGYRRVHGVVDFVTDMLVHETEGGDLHGFCDTCVSANAHEMVKDVESLTNTLIGIETPKKATNRFSTMSSTTAVTETEIATSPMPRSTIEDEMKGSSNLKKAMSTMKSWRMRPW